MSELPSHWATTPLENLVEILDSRRIPLNAQERERRITDKDQSSLYPYYGATGLVGYVDDYIFDEPLILLGEDGVPFLDPVRPKAYLVSGKYWVNNHAHVLLARDGLADRRYLCAFLNYCDYTEKVTGSTRLKLTQEAMRSIQIPLAPLNEQKRIADKLDVLLARVDACRERLDRVSLILKRFRQAVLAAATSGRLTEEWREERGQCDDWPRHRIGKVTSKVGSGATPKGGETSYRTSGVPLIRSMNVVFHGFKREGLAFLDFEQADQLRNVEVDAKDVLLNITGASIGRVTLAPTDLAGARVNQHVCIIRPTQVLLPEFLSAFLSAPVMQQVIGAENYGVTRQALTKQQILDFEVPVPPIDEQHEIVRRLEALFVFVDHLEVRCLAAQVKVERLTPSLLAKAFRGELVPQDPNDEPAAVLLDHIRAARASAAAQPKQPRRRPAMEQKATTRKIPAGSAGIIHVLQEAGRELSSKDLFAAAGYPPDADPEKVEAFFVAVRGALKQGQITRERRRDMDWFSLAPQ